MILLKRDEEDGDKGDGRGWKGHWIVWMKSIII